MESQSARAWSSSGTCEYKAEGEEPRDWQLPLDRLDERRPAGQIRTSASPRASRRCSIRARASASKASIPARRAPIRPSDFLILVRKRDAFFEAMIRALKERDIPTAGADRLKLGEHIAVMDMIAAAQAALLPEDDLTLATRAEIAADRPR